MDFLYVKSCCFCLKLKTGCYLIALVYLLQNLMYFFLQLDSAIGMFRNSVRDQKLAVAFAYDISPTVMIIFGFCFIYGLYKDNKFFIFYGSTLVTLALCIDVFSIIDLFVKWLVGFHYIFVIYALDLFLFSVFHCVCLVVVLSHHNQIALNDRPGVLVNEEDAIPSTS